MVNVRFCPRIWRYSPPQSSTPCGEDDGQRCHRHADGTSHGAGTHGRLGLRCCTIAGGVVVCFVVGSQFTTRNKGGLGNPPHPLFMDCFMFPRVSNVSDTAVVFKGVAVRATMLSGKYRASQIHTRQVVGVLLEFLRVIHDGIRIAIAPSHRLANMNQQSRGTGCWIVES